MWYIQGQRVGAAFGMAVRTGGEEGSSLPFACLFWSSGLTVLLRLVIVLVSRQASALAS